MKASSSEPGCRYRLGSRELAIAALEQARRHLIADAYCLTSASRERCANDVAALLPLVPKVLEAIPKAPRGKVPSVS